MVPRTAKPPVYPLRSPSHLAASLFFSWLTGAMSACGPSATSRNVRLESEMRSITDISWSVTPPAQAAQKHDSEAAQEAIEEEKRFVRC
jgi:hypothetical protein